MVVKNTKPFAFSVGFNGLLLVVAAEVFLLYFTLFAITEIRNITFLFVDSF